MPTKAADLDEVRERRYVLKDMLNTNLLHPKTREQFEAEYAETGKTLEEAAKKAS